jgi:hypothetical protein
VEGGVEDFGLGFVACFGGDHGVPPGWYLTYRLVGIVSTSFSLCPETVWECCRPRWIQGTSLLVVA